MSRRVIVDENVGPGTEVWEQFERAFGDQQCEYVFRAKTHCGIPDVEILEKLLRPGTVLLTGDCVLHMRAIERGYRSYTLNECGQLTRKRLPSRYGTHQVTVVARLIKNRRTHTDNPIRTRRDPNHRSAQLERSEDLAAI